MNCKIFDFDLYQGMIIGDEKHTDLFMKIDGEDWFLCFGDFEPFEQWDNKKTIEALCKAYFEGVKEKEKAIQAHFEEVAYWENLKSEGFFSN